MRKSNFKGYLCLVFHSHLPFVRHPEHESFLEEDWLYEAITETYVPLIMVFDQLISENIDFRVTMSLSPTLIAMLTDDLLKIRYATHLDKLIELAHKEVERTSWTPDFRKLALMYLDLFIAVRDKYRQYNGNLISAFKKFFCANSLYLPG